MNNTQFNWRRVENGLPSINQSNQDEDGGNFWASNDVFIAVGGIRPHISYLVEGGRWVNVENGNYWPDGAVTHWMLIPPLAEDESHQSNGAEMISQERARQVAQEGYSSEHDSAHSWGQLSMAATAYARAGFMASIGFDESAIRLASEEMWPFGLHLLKTEGNTIRFYQKAGALIAAEIDRLLALEQTREDTNV